MFKRTNPATLTPEQRERLDDPALNEDLDKELAKSLGTWPDVLRYIESQIESEVAYRQRRRSLVPGDEISRVGTVAFPGPLGDLVREIVDLQVRNDVIGVMVLSPGLPADEYQRSVQAEDIRFQRVFDTEFAPVLQDYIRRRIQRVADYGGATEDQPPTRSREVDRVPSVYLGVYRNDASYDRGHMVTRNGLLWHCNVNGATERPGTGPAWTMMHKSNAKDDRHGAAA